MGGEAGALELLASGTLEVLGRMPWASNQTYLGRLGEAELEVPVVYKPERGERPLWDFPAGTLWRREMAAFEISAALGWGIVPPTVLRDGPLGRGMVQLFVDHDPREHYFTLREAFSGRFRQFALFDVVANNADRKAGHCLRGADDHIWGIDHGVTFHASIKLRTVIWDFGGEPVPPDALADLTRLASAFEGELGGRLGELLSGPEVEAAYRRLEWLLTQRVFPGPLSEYPYPWPMV